MISWIQFLGKAEGFTVSNNLDVSLFPTTREIYENEFNNILSGIAYCYKRLLKDGQVVPPNNENRIRDVLLINYLKNRVIKEKANLNEFRFDREIQEDATKGRVDIRVITKNDFENDDAYYIIECKRLDNKNLTGTSGLNAEYIKEGIMRFVNVQYSSYYEINGMIGFIIEKMKINKNISNLNNLMKTKITQANVKKQMTRLKEIKKFRYSYFSKHRTKAGNTIRLCHLMLDFSKNLECGS